MAISNLRSLVRTGVKMSSYISAPPCAGMSAGAARKSACATKTNTTAQLFVRGRLSKSILTRYVLVQCVTRIDGCDNDIGQPLPDGRG